MREASNTRVASLRNYQAGLQRQKWEVLLASAQCALCWTAEEPTKVEGLELTVESHVSCVREPKSLGWKPGGSGEHIQRPWRRPELL